MSNFTNLKNGYFTDNQSFVNFVMFYDTLQNRINTIINNQNLFRRNALYIGILVNEACALNQNLFR